MHLLSELVGEILASALGVIFGGWIWPRYLWPLIESITWGGTSISGAWEFFDDNPRSSTRVGVAVIRQRGRSVSMTAARERDRSGETTTEQYRATGRFSSRQLTLVFNAVDRPDYVLGALVLYLDTEGRQFEGHTVHYDEAERAVVALPFWLRRARI